MISKDQENPIEGQDSNSSPQQEETILEVAGGLRNALDKGVDLEKAKQSFLNGGYSLQEVDAAIASLNTQVENNQPTAVQEQVQTRFPLNVKVKKEKFGLFRRKKKLLIRKSLPSVRKQIKKETKQLPLSGKKPKGVPKWLIILLIILGIILVLVAGFIGVYWDQLFGPF